MTPVETTFSGGPWKWKIDYRSKSVEKKIEKKIKRHGWKEFYKEYKEDVSKDPFRSDDSSKIRKLQPQFGYPKGYYRYKKSDMRVVYTPEKPAHTVITVEIGSAGDIGYKKG